MKLYTNKRLFNWIHHPEYASLPEENKKCKNSLEILLVIADFPYYGHIFMPYK